MKTNQVSRTKKTALNSTVGLACTVISSLLSFVLQAVFIRVLDEEYTGINSLFTDILKILNLADLGMGNAIMFRLYKANNRGDDDAVEMYLTAYKKICWLVGVLVGVAGLVCIPFLNFFVKEKPSFPEPLWALYLFVLGDSVVAHFVDYKGILTAAKQDRYINIIIQYICIFLKHGLQIAVLVLFKSIYLYLAVSVFTTLLKGVATGIVSDRRYHLSWHSKRHLPKGEGKELTKDVGTLAVFKFCRTLNVTIDTFLISKFIAVGLAGIYGSVSVITAALNNLLGTLNDGMIASVGDLNATGDKAQLEKVLDVSAHMMYLLFGICVAVLTPFLRPFTLWWLDGRSLDPICLYVMLFNFYIGGLNTNISSFRNAMGLFRKGWKRPAATVALNGVLSIVLIQKIGLLGALIGTTVAYLATLVWYDPYVIYKYGLGKSCRPFFVRYFLHILIVAVTSVGMYFLGTLLPAPENLFAFVWQGILYLVCASAILLGFGTLFPAQKMTIQRILSLLKR